MCSVIVCSRGLLGVLKWLAADPSLGVLGETGERGDTGDPVPAAFGDDFVDIVRPAERETLLPLPLCLLFPAELGDGLQSGIVNEGR
jgi:hypothetical protein